MKQAPFRFIITDYSKGEILLDRRGSVEDLENLFPREIYEFLKKEDARDRLVDTTLRMEDFTYEIKKKQLKDMVLLSKPSRTDGISK